MYGPPYTEWVLYGPTCKCGPPLPYMEQVLYGPLHVHMVPPHVKCLHVIYYSYGPPIPYMEWELYVPTTCMYGPPHVLYDVNDSDGPPHLIWNGYLKVLPYLK